MAYVKDYGYGSQTVDVEATTSSVYRSMFGWMAGGLGITALTSFVIMDRLVQSDAFAEIFFSKGMMWFLIIASFGMVIGLSSMIHRLSFMTASIMFSLYAVVMGAWITPVLLLYTGESVFQVFLITAGTFAGMAVYGHFTKADLSKVGKIAIMALWGVIIASLVNFFMQSSMMSYIISYISVAIFCGLTMYDVQKFKELIESYGETADDNVRKIALIGALSLYLDFLNLFLTLLRIMGNRR